MSDNVFSENVYMSNVADILDVIYECSRDEVVPCLLGAPGIGKTQAVYQLAERKGVDVVEMILSQRLPTEISGLVMPDNESKSMEVFDHSRLSSLKDGDILLFDEMLEAPPMVLSACLTLIQERRMMSGKKLPDIMIVAAANPLATPSLMKLSQRQRFMFINVLWDKLYWCQYIKDNMKIDVSDFLLNRIQTDGTGWNVFTPRTCTKLLKMAKKCNDIDVRAGDDSSVKLFKRFCSNMYDVDVADEIIKIVKKIDPMDSLISYLDGYYGVFDDAVFDRYNREIRDQLLNAEPKDIIDILSKLDEWDAIKDDLAKIEIGF